MRWAGVVVLVAAAALMGTVRVAAQTTTEKPASGEECVSKFRSCEMECLKNETEPASLCTEVCEKEHDCKLPSCPESFNHLCLLYAAFDRECTVDADCAVGSRCCRTGYLGCQTSCLKLH